MRILAKIQNFYEYVARKSVAQTKKERLQLIHSLIVASIGISLSILFLIYNLAAGNVSNSIYVSMFLASLLGIFVFIVNKINLDFVYNFLNLSFIVLLILLTQGEEPSGILWAYIYPMSAVFLFGTKMGIFWSFMMLISVLVAAYVSQVQFGDNPLIFMIRFSVTYLASTAIASWFNYYKDLYYNELEYINKMFKNEHKVLENEISERKELEGRLATMAYTDSLTNLLNRRYFWELGNKEIMRSRRYGVPMCLAVLDIDHFKIINDTCGHPIGDEVLRVLSRHCKYVLRESDILGRIGGDEFAFVLVHVTPQEALEKFNALKKEIASLDLRNLKDKIDLTVSIGVAVLNDDIERLEQLYKVADNALYKAKQKGRNRIVLAS